MTGAVLLALQIALAFAVLGLASYTVATLSWIGETLTKEREGRAENDRNVRRLQREVSAFAADVAARVERNVKMRECIGALIEDLVKRARAMHEFVATRDGELRSRGMTPERLGAGWGAYFDGASKGELDRIMLRI